MIGFLESAVEDFTSTGLGLTALAVFGLAYALVVTEDLIHLRKSKPVIAGAGIIWILTALAYSTKEGLDPHFIEERVMHHVADFGALFLFLMVAMTYISAIAHRNVFLKLNAILVSSGFGLRSVFWATGALAFVISPIADNLTTALLMGAVVSTVGRQNTKFIGVGCVNIVVAANAGGAFSPFGDITTLLVWQEGHVGTAQFFQLVPPSLVNWLIPAVCMHFAIPNQKPDPVTEDVELKQGWLVVILLFLATIATAVCFHMFLHLPPFLGMTTGLAYFMLYGYLRTMKAKKVDKVKTVDVFDNIAEVEWDTLLFFFGVILCVGGLSELGYLTIASEFLYDDLGPTVANVGVGLISAVLDNVPVMFAVLGMEPDMLTASLRAAEASPEVVEKYRLYQWLLVTLTAGVGGSLLSVGSAAGVALMGTARGRYTFFGHLKWIWAIALGYAGSIWVHALINAPGGA